MSKKKIDRIDVFNELTKSGGSFDFKKCEKILGDNYNNFARFCQAIELIPEDIKEMTVVSFPDIGTNNAPATFLIELNDGQKITLET